MLALDLQDLGMNLTCAIETAKLGSGRPTNITLCSGYIGNTTPM